MAVKSSILLTDDQHRFAKELFDAGPYLNVCAVLQKGIELLRQRLHDDDLQRAARKALCPNAEPGRSSAEPG